ncbi:amino acid permease [Estrella lausannensis]|uniref:Aromatic amino acid permease n=1 Tax=Estrella lausannensis TaxID=483423 RepID=A0A0H5DRV5_9BACT|nr:aromatic amino acid transport family protein [Estrella lausannensis]CRX39357.1 aromatic amino acid permease [Estrella lausannensis]
MAEIENDPGMVEEIQDALFEEKEPEPSLINAIFLITGTCIGAGMLALPFVTAYSGFLPALLIGFISWIFMMATGLLFLEATLWMPDGANVISLSRHFLGRTGQWIGAVLFLFLYLCLMVSYIDEGSALFGSFMSSYISPLESTLQLIFFSVIFGALVLVGTQIVGKVNGLLVLGLVLSYFLIVVAGIGSVEAPLALRADWSLWYMAAPTLFSAYGYHNILPTLSTYLKRDTKKLRIAVIVGTTIPFIVYTLWQLLIIGAVPVEHISQIQGLQVRSWELLGLATDSVLLKALGKAFAFFAIVTSLLGVALSMVDFLGDGLKVKRSGLTRVFLTMAVFIPPTIFASTYPGIFVEAIGVAGGIGEAILNGIMPVLMVYVGRFKMGLPPIYRFPFERTTLSAFIVFTLLIMFIEIRHLMS